jgi:DNA-binding NarL/FixJ family response regulator
MKTNGLLIVDDHPVYREALTEKLGADFAPLGVHVAGAASADEGLEILAKDHLRWTVLLDIQMPGLSGLAVIRSFKSQPQVSHVVAISGLDEKLWEPRSVNAGATLFLSKNHTSQFIFRKLDMLIRGQSAGTSLTEEGLPPPSFRLTDRQREVLSLIAQGHPNKIIAHFLEISEQTVKIHISQIFKELRVFNRTQAVLRAQKSNLL